MIATQFWLIYQYPIPVANNTREKKEKATQQPIQSILEITGLKPETGPNNTKEVLDSVLLLT
jgi:hypothetical protein